MVGWWTGHAWKAIHELQPGPYTVQLKPSATKIAITSAVIMSDQASSLASSLECHVLTADFPSVNIRPPNGD